MDFFLFSPFVERNLIDPTTGAEFGRAAEAKFAGHRQHGRHGRAAQGSRGAAGAAAWPGPTVVLVHHVVSCSIYS